MYASFDWLVDWLTICFHITTLELSLTSFYIFVDSLPLIHFNINFLLSGKQRITSSFRRAPECDGAHHVQVPTTSGPAGDRQCPAHTAKHSGASQGNAMLPLLVTCHITENSPLITLMVFVITLSFYTSLLVRQLAAQIERVSEMVAVMRQAASLSDDESNEHQRLITALATENKVKHERVFSTCILLSYQS